MSGDRGSRWPIGTGSALLAVAACLLAVGLSSTDRESVLLRVPLPLEKGTAASGEFVPNQGGSPFLVAVELPESLPGEPVVGSPALRVAFRVSRGAVPVTGGREAWDEVSGGLRVLKTFEGEGGGPYTVRMEVEEANPRLAAATAHLSVRRNPARALLSGVARIVCLVLAAPLVLIGAMVLLTGLLSRRRHPGGARAEVDSPAGTRP